MGENEYVLIRKLEALEKRLEELEVHEEQRWVMLTTPLTSTSWDGDSFSTTAKTLIDLSAVFGVPANVKAVLVNGNFRDSGSVAFDAMFRLSPNDTVYSATATWTADRAGDDYYTRYHGVIPCDSNGDIYYQIIASGANTMDISLNIWGYLI